MLLMHVFTLQKFHTSVKNSENELETSQEGMTHTDFQKFHTSVKNSENELAKRPKRVISMTNTDFQKFHTSVKNSENELETSQEGMTHTDFQKFHTSVKNSENEFETSQEGMTHTVMDNLCGWALNRKLAELCKVFEDKEDEGAFESKLS
ncbi:CLUMA_CG007157, isoform A [Clunio marinus]|uniref:CLUMA_CG007157, isoform A n=1 Tax=Clunio marinus TaxID=568069 RepID=A0A1J1I090_9DIPT|nr:CLUMA_CG007157, isoform A [Clunio marinus]